jgi:hypothetical protein
MRDLEECLGEDHHKIQRWIEKDWLRDHLQGTRRHGGNGRDIHRFREKEILEFLRRHPEEINLGKVDAIWFLDLVLLNGREIGEETAYRRKGEVNEGDEIGALGLGHAESRLEINLAR